VLIPSPVFLVLLYVSVVNRIAFAFAFQRHTPSLLLQRHAQYARGGHSRANREICVISAASAGTLASQYSQFSAMLPHIRLPFQREICTNCEICESCESKRSACAPPPE
jgi:hypothetical protein